MELKGSFFYSKKVSVALCFRSPLSLGGGEVGVQTKTGKEKERADSKKSTKYFLSVSRYSLAGHSRL